MNILEAWKSKIIFGFYNHAAFAAPEAENGGFSVRLFANGTVLYQTYSLNAKCEPTIKESDRAVLSDGTVSRITRALAGYSKEIDALPEYTNNGSYDGTFYDFVFCGKYVSSINIQRTDLSEVMRENPDYYEKYRFDIADENTILDIFTRIAESMLEDGIRLYLNHLYVGENKIY